MVVVYKIDRLSRSPMDFSKLVEVFDRNGVTFVSLTQSFNTTLSMGRLTLNILLSFAQFEREVTAERIRDKVRASRMKGMWMGGYVQFGYDVTLSRFKNVSAGFLLGGRRVKALVGSWFSAPAAYSPRKSAPSPRLGSYSCWSGDS